MPAPSGFYDDPALYDTLHAPGTAEEVRDLLAAARRHSPHALRNGAVWLEPACGSGRLLAPLARRGFKVVGFDLSQRMVDFAKARLPRGARIFRADMTDFSRHVPPASIDFAFNPINTVRHLHSDRAMLAHFRSIARALKPGGAYALGVGLAAYGLETETEDVWTGRRRGTTVTQVVQYIPARGGRDRRERVLSHITVSRARRSSDFDVAYDLRTYSKDEWFKLLDRSALSIAAVCDERGEETPAVAPGYFVFILRRRGDQAMVVAGGSKGSIRARRKKA